MTAKSIVTNIVCVAIVAPILAALILWGCWVLIPEQPPPPEADSTTSASTAVIRPAPHTPVSGRTVYMANCARCHGATGDGQGTEQLDRPARSFLAGGFSFGNTPEAVRRVVQHGIAGTPMPGFLGTLSPAQTGAVVNYVLAMSPPSDNNTEDAVLVVRDRPLVLRGMLPPSGPWAESRPRGLLLGGTDGLTLAYNADDVRFRGARQGEFAKRTDWEGRGGTPLEPLGRPVHWNQDQPQFARQGRPVRAVLRGTSTIGDHAAIRFALPGVEVTEYGATHRFGPLSGYTRTLTLDGDASRYTMALPSIHPLEGQGSSRGWHWWRGGDDLIGVRGAAPAGDRVTLPSGGTVEILVLPEVDDDAARAAGIVDGSVAL
jgi:mono/diheme cytochrome c family protein